MKTSLVFDYKIISNDLVYRIKNNNGQKDNRTRSPFHKNIAKLVLLWPYMGQKHFEVLKNEWCV